MEFVFIIIVVFSVIIVVHVKGNKKTRMAWRTIADELGLTILGTRSPSLTGVYDNRTVKVKIYTESHGKSSQTYTGFEVEYQKPIRTDFQLGRQGFFQNVIGLAGVTDIEIGDPDFDKTVLVKGRDEKGIQSFFQSERARYAVMNIMRKSRYTNIKITNFKIAVSVPGKLMDLTEFKAVLLHLLSVTHLLEDEGNKKTQVNQNPSPPPLPLKKKALSVPEEWHGEPEVIEPPAATFPREVEIPIEEPALIPAPVVDSVAEEAPAVNTIEINSLPVTDSISIEEIADEIFEAKLGKYQAGKRFEDLFKGEPVHWNCRLRKIVSGSSDRFFGRDSGWIAIFDLGSFPGMENGTGPLMVKYHIGPETWESFRDREGSTCPINGELVKFDPFSTTLYIESGDPVEKKGHSGTVKIESYADRMKKEMHSRPGEVRRFS